MLSICVDEAEMVHDRDGLRYDVLEADDDMSKSNNSTDGHIRWRHWTAKAGSVKSIGGWGVSPFVTPTGKSISVSGSCRA